MNEHINHVRRHTLANREMLRLPAAPEFWGIAGPDLRQDLWFPYEPCAAKRVAGVLRRVAAALAGRWRRRGDTPSPAAATGAR